MRQGGVGRARREFDAEFEAFFARDYDDLVGALAVIVGDRDVAREAVGEAVAKAWDQRRRGREIECLRAWVRVVALNQARGTFRRRASERRARERLASQVVHTVEQDNESLSEVGVEVQQALARLPRRQREVAVLRYLLAEPTDEIARTLGISEHAVRNHLQRARAALQGVLYETRRTPPRARNESRRTRGDVG